MTTAPGGSAAGDRPDLQPKGRRFHWGGLNIGRFTPSVVLLIFLPVLLLFIGATSPNSRAIFQEVLERYQLPAIRGGAHLRARRESGAAQFAGNEGSGAVLRGS